MNEAREEELKVIDDSHSTVSELPVFQRAQLETTSGGDRQFADQVLRVFVSEIPSRICSIRRAVESGEYRNLRYHARAAKCGSQAVGAIRLAEVCSELEERAQGGDVLPVISSLVKEARRFRTHVNQQNVF